MRLLTVSKCCIPCFEGLFPSPHDETIQDLLYIMAYWHSLAKLRMHTDSSVNVLDRTTSTLGDALRFFANETCRHFATVETDAEYRARGRAMARRFTRTGAQGTAPQPAGKRPRTFNLTTAKLHFLGDYVPQIRWFGTTDSYTSQTVCNNILFFATCT